MKRLPILLLTALIVVSCKSKEKEVTEEAEDTAANTEVMTEETEEPQWMVLFDGTSTDQWRGYMQDDIYPEWTIDGDALAFTPGEEGGKNIITKEKFRNFKLSMEWKVSEGGNSGIFWAVVEDERFPEAYQTGPEIQVLDNERHPDAKVAGGTHTAGALYDMIKPKVDATNPAGEWNLCEITVDYTNNYGSVTMNGEKIVEFPVTGPKWEAMVAGSKFADWEGFAMSEEGHIGLQDHSDKVWYRNIKIQVLD